MTVAELRVSKDRWAQDHINSDYRREAEYANYVLRFLHSSKIVDGMKYDERKSKVPMPYNIYFG